MNLIKKKQTWKLLLGVIAIMIAFSTYYFNQLVIRKILHEEENRLKIWAEAVRRKAEVLSSTRPIFEKIAAEERKKIEIWAEANKKIASSTSPNDLDFYLKIIAGNNTIPVIAVDNEGKILAHRNLFPENYRPSENEIRVALDSMKKKYPPIEIIVWKDKKQFLYYDDSNILKALKKMINEQLQSFFNDIISGAATVPVIITDSSFTNVVFWGNIDSLVMQDDLKRKKLLEKLRGENQPIAVYLGDPQELHYILYEKPKVLKWLEYFPYLQLPLIAILVFTGYLLYNTVRTAEQNLLWVGMAKETAHQLGTPVSSLMAWIELIKARYPDSEEIKELESDTERLRIITDRFSAIGSKPRKKVFDLVAYIEDTANYLQKRLSGNITINIHAGSNKIMFLGNQALIGWMIENLVKNAVDAMQGKGRIDIFLQQNKEMVEIHVKDQGKGIEKKYLKQIFKPGFTTKELGWGLGLSLVKRIVEEYHQGKIYIEYSSPGAGTCFKIILPSGTNTNELNAGS